jgi:hypothetical protein
VSALFNKLFFLKIFSKFGRDTKIIIIIIKILRLTDSHVTRQKMTEQQQQEERRVEEEEDQQSLPVGLSLLIEGNLMRRTVADAGPLDWKLNDPCKESIIAMPIPGHGQLFSPWSQTGNKKSRNNTGNI